MVHLGSSTVAFCALVALTPLAVEAQDGSRWFWDFSAGWSSAIAPGNAYDGGPSTRVGLGVALNPAVRLRLALAGDHLPYSDERFGELFAMADARAPDAGELSASSQGLIGAVEWSPGMATAFRPWVGAGLILRNRSTSSFIASPAWVRCSPLVDAPEPGCTALRRDIDVDGGSVGLTTSVGLTFGAGAKPLAVGLHLSTGMVRGPLLTGDLTWRHFF